MKIGVLLPTFTARPERVFSAVREAERVGIHGVFVYDHLWQPETDRNPALSPFPLLGAVAARTERVRIGTLVARVGLLLDELLVSSFLTLDALSGGRVIAGIGTGDVKSAAENAAFGLAYDSAIERRIALSHCATGLVDAGIETWIGGGGQATNSIAHAMGVPVNLWAATPARIAELSTVSPVTWGGVLRSGVDGGTLLVDLDAAGASWAVFTWGRGLGPLLEAVNAAGMTLDT